MPLALPPPSGQVFNLNQQTLSEGKLASQKSPRRRIALPLHRNQDARVQRLINFLQPQTYIRPHCHPLPHASESICLLEGHLEVLIFTSLGVVTERHHLLPSHPLIDLEPGIWHGMIVHTPDTVIFETKLGPYHAATDKQFATWAPPEDSAEASSFLDSLSDDHQ